MTFNVLYFSHTFRYTCLKEDTTYTNRTAWLRGIVWLLLPSTHWLFTFLCGTKKDLKTNSNHSDVWGVVRGVLLKWLIFRTLCETMNDVEMFWNATGHPLWTTCIFTGSNWHPLQTKFLQLYYIQIDSRRDGSRKLLLFSDVLLVYFFNSISCWTNGMTSSSYVSHTIT